MKKKDCKHNFHFVKVVEGYNFLMTDDFAVFVCDKCGLVKKVNIFTEENQ